MVLAAEDPAALARFYAAVLPCQAVQGWNPQHWCLPLPQGGELQIYSPSRRRPLARGRARLSLCLQRRGDGAVLEHWLAQAQAAGASLLEPCRQEPFGWEAWLADPEGNGLLLLVQPESATTLAAQAP